MILVIGIELLKESFLKVLHPTPVTLGALTIAVLVVSILVKLWMSSFNRSVGSRIKSERSWPLRRMPATMWLPLPRFWPLPFWLT